MTLIGVLAVVTAVCLGWSGARRIQRGVRDAASLELVRGIRALVTAAAVAVVALALLTGERGLLAFAAVFLAEEIYETGVLVLIIRSSGEAGPPRAIPGRESQAHILTRCSRPASMSSSEPKAIM